MKPIPVELMRAAKAGDRAAVSEVWRRVRSVVVYALRLWPRGDKEEMFQECGLAFCHALHGWREDGGAQFQTYLAQWVQAYVGRRGKVDLRRARTLLTLDRPSRPSAKESDEALDDDDETDPSDGGRQAEESQEAVDVARAAAVARSLKDPLVRAVLVGRMLRGWTLDEVGQAAGVSRERVRQVEREAVRVASAVLMRGDLSSRAEAVDLRRWSKARARRRRPRKADG